MTSDSPVPRVRPLAGSILWLLLYGCAAGSNYDRSAAPLGGDQDRGEVPGWRTEEGRVETWKGLATWYIDNDFGSEALRMVEQIRESGHRGREIDVIQARAMIAVGLPSEAMGILQGVTAQSPRFAQGWNVLASAYAALDDYDSAAEAYQKALQLDSRLSSAKNNLGFLLFTKGQCDEAVTYLQDAVSDDSTEILYRSNLAYALVCAGQPRRAIDLLRTLHPEEDARYNMGVAYERLDKVEPAVLQYEQALRVNPDHEPAASALARLRPESDHHAPEGATP